MARPEKTVRGRARLARDSQQWMLDYLIQETGKVFHFQGDGRGRLPRSVRSHDMISKHVGLQARRMEALAQAEAAAEHPETALDFYIPGCDTLKEAWPHPFAVAEEMAQLLPNGAFIPEWKAGTALAAAKARMKQFLAAHTPVRA